MVHLNNPDPVVIERTFSILHHLIEDGGMKKHTGLLIVILPDYRWYDGKQL